MKVYIAKREYDYEGFQILGIFKTMEEAQSVCDNDIFGDGTEYGDSHDVEEFEIGKLYK